MYGIIKIHCDNNILKPSVDSIIECALKVMEIRL